MFSKRTKGVIGILVAEGRAPVPFAEPGYCRKLCQIGSSRGMTVYVFCPSFLRPGGESVPGYSYENGGWHHKLFPPPDVIYDRCFTHDRRQQQRKRQALSRLSAQHPFVYLTRGLTGKWQVYQALRKFPELESYLPETARYEGPEHLAVWLRQHGDEAFLKPEHGTHGKRTLHVKRSELHGGLKITGRDPRNGILHKQFSIYEEGLDWIHRFTSGRSFLIQPFLELNTAKKEPFDIRVLVQKNDTGAWEITGTAARVGVKNALTSNLHGGGTAHRALPVLIRELGMSGAKAALASIRELALRIPPALESHFGRLAELGIDFGIDRKVGRIWVLEVNSKPGRSSFFRIGDRRSARKSVENPILYARYLLLSKP